MLNEAMCNHKMKIVVDKGEGRTKSIIAWLSRIEKSGLTITEFFKKYKVPFSHSQYYLYKKRLEEFGESGLCDKRSAGGNRKLTVESEAFIAGCVESNPEVSLQWIQEALNKRYCVTLTPSGITRLLQRLNPDRQKRAKGRQRKYEQKARHNSCGGFELIIKNNKEDHAKRLMKEVGLDENSIYRYPHEFSGGQRQRISIARSISLKPDLLVCDEPVSALDVSVQAQIINLLLDLRDSYNLSYIFISHDISIVSNIANRIAVMYLGKIVEQGPASDIINNPMHPYTKALINAVPTPGIYKKKKIVLKGETPSPSSPPPGCRFHTRCPEVMDACGKIEPQESKTGMRQVWCHLYKG